MYSKCTNDEEKKRIIIFALNRIQLKILDQFQPNVRNSCTMYGCCAKKENKS